MLQKQLKRFKRGPYFVCHEEWKHEPTDPPVLMRIARNEFGHYIGETAFAHRLWKKYGIEQFELSKCGNNVCSVGYNPATHTWYGWSHRAINGFPTRSEAAKFARSVS